MSEITVVPEALHAYAATSASMSSTVLTAASVNTAANTAAMVGVFGLIGQEFLASFVAAQAAHLAGVGRLAAVHAGTAAAALAGATDFTGTDTDAAAAVRAIGGDR